MFTPERRTTPERGGQGQRHWKREGGTREILPEKVEEEEPLENIGRDQTPETREEPQEVI